MTAQVLRLRDHRPVADLTPDEARQLTDRIKAHVTELLPLIKEAFERRADVALGYTNWPDYCDQELRGLRLPVAQRREAVAELAQTGMSTRAIGSALGVDHKTVSNDLRSAGENSPPGKDLSLATVTGLDGKQYPATRPAPVDAPAGPDVASPPAASEPPDRPGTTDPAKFPLVLVSQAPRPLPPARAELREQHPTRPGIVKVVYEASRTAAWIDRSRIIIEPVDPLGDQYESDPLRRAQAVAALAPEYVRPAPESPQEGVYGGGVTRAAGAPAPRPVHVTLTQREADLLSTYAADILDTFHGEDRDTLLAALHKVGDALIAARRTEKQSGPSASTTTTR